MTAAPLLAGVVGHPIDHSLSPHLHRFWLKRAGISGLYVPTDAAPDAPAFATTADRLRTLGFRGFNVTLPHKAHALAWADAASEAATRVGAANMITFEGDISYADNSDAYGFMRALKASGTSLNGPVAVLGAGGAARGVIEALAQAGATRIRIVNRTRSRAAALAADRADLAIDLFDWSECAEALVDADLLVNTTSLGMTGAPPLEIPLAALAGTAAVADIVYAPLETPLLAAARAEGRRTIDGLEMLMHQAVPGFRAWFGAEPSVDADVRAHLAAVLAERAK